MIIIFPCKVERTEAPREGAARGRRAPAGVYLPYTFTISKKYPHTHKKYICLYVFIHKKRMESKLVIFTIYSSEFIERLSICR